VSETRQSIFGVAVSGIGRLLLIRDRLLGWVPREPRESPSPEISRHTIASGGHRLDALLVVPEQARGSLLICHGIGETVQHWLPVQQVLAESGVASLVFDYVGYGRSAGWFSTGQSERDAIAAFHFLEERTAPLPVAVLGFSLGSGVAAAIVGRVPADRLVLCAAFTSLRKAAVSVGIPRMLEFVVPPVWDAEVGLRACGVAVLVVQGAKDRLFPVRMAEVLHGFCGAGAQLVVVPNLSHNEPFRHPKAEYWGQIVARFVLGTFGTADGTCGAADAACAAGEPALPQER